MRRPSCPARGPLRFLHAGQLGLRKGTPLLLQAWRAAQLEDCELHLVGPWQLARSVRAALPPSVFVHPPQSWPQLREHYRAAQVFVFPSHFEGFGLVLLEAMACGLPAIASEAGAGPDRVGPATGLLVREASVDAWVEALRNMAGRRDELPAMAAAARAKACEFTWERYRREVAGACAAYC